MAIKDNYYFGEYIMLNPAFIYKSLVGTPFIKEKDHALL
jgi:hypothetical protein